jgi:uncharacterized protein (TIGR00375 family)
MKAIADLHIHGPYSRATSKDITLQNLERHARTKGLNLLGTGDFTHPEWLKMIRQGLSEDGTGILKTPSGFSFILSTEISSIYSYGGKVRRVHNIILAPDLETVDQINTWLLTKGRLDYDGRPTFGFSCPELVESLMEISDKILIIPAHVWTPWFSVFGSNSGFNSIEECFQDQTRHIYAIETGLSSDPAMNWRLSQLDRLAIVSFSDAHSMWPWRIGREATVFDLNKLDYNQLFRAIKTREGLVETLEFFPEEGKYHYDGHRDCGVSMEPREAIRQRNICPVCRKPLTIGVLHRVEELADRPVGHRPEGAKPFRSVIPLSEIIAFMLKAQPSSRSVWEEYNKLINAFGSELGVLLEAEETQLKNIAGKGVAEMILRVRSGQVKMKPGFDGVYGEIADKDPERIVSPQKSLSDFGRK